MINTTTNYWDNDQGKVFWIQHDLYFKRFITGYKYWQRCQSGL